MNKQEILEKSRKSKVDEGMEHAKSRGHRVGWIVFLIIVVPIIGPITIFQMQDRFDLLHALGAIAFGLCFTETFSTYRFCKKKSHLAWAVGSFIMTVVCTILIWISVWQGV